MLVYRDGKRELRTAELLDELIGSLRDAAAEPANQSELLLATLLRAGALECALSDGGPVPALTAVQGSPRSPLSGATEVCAGLTDTLSDLALGSRSVTEVQAIAAEFISQIQKRAFPERVCVSAPEGFAYYALDPQAYANAAGQIEIGDRPVFVIGLRTIGATLSAIVAATARNRGARVVRTTVRPVGHPWDRTTEFNNDQHRRILDAASQRAMFFVVDEGPGLSGSSLMSVADALVSLGVARSEIVVMCAHAPNLANLRSRRAAESWPRLRVVTAGRTLQPPDDAATEWSGGSWRAHLYLDPAQWPAIWPQIERLKFLSRDGMRVYKFEGLGPYGERPMEQARAAAEAGWSPGVHAMRNGFASYDRIDGAPMSHSDLDPQIIETLAQYCDFRQREMRAEIAPLDPLREMARVNVWEEFGVEDTGDDGEIARPVIADARMMPHEWVRDRTGRIWKTDVASHGDDHFYPGATDIVWDLAGAIVEWRMNDAAADAFVERYRKISGDDARARLPFFLRAYVAFRMGFCRMAAKACAEERERLTNAAEYYSSILRPVPRRARAKAFSELLYPRAL